MNLLGIAVVLVLLVGVWAQINVQRPECDSPEAEEAALVALDYINAQHTHGYKYALNRIEDIRVYTTPMGNSTYVLDIELLETDCHVLDPTPLANCTVRPKALTAVEGDCDVVLKKIEGALAVTAFKCKTSGSTEDLCLGCPTLLPLNHTDALDFVLASLVNLNNVTGKKTFVLHEIGRMSTQLVSGGPIFMAEYIIVDANCTGDFCVPLQGAMARRGICSAKGLLEEHTLDCVMFPVQMPSGNGTGPAHPAVLPEIHEHSNYSLSPKHGRRFHKLTTLHNPEQSTYLSAESKEESDESAEVVPEAPTVVTEVVTEAAATDPAPDAAAPLPVDDSISASDSSNSKEIPPHIMFKRDVAVPAADVAAPAASPTDHIVLMPVCPGRVRFF